MGNSSSTADQTVTDDPYTSKKQPKVTRLKLSEMAVTMETQVSQHGDLNLMGLQELDSHMSIFETSNPGRDSSTPGVMSSSGYEDSLNIVDQHSHTIIVDSPGENHSPKSHYGPGSRFADQKFSG